MSAVAVPAAPRSTAPAARSWATLAGVALAQFMVILDATVVNVALPSIGRSLGFASADLQWVVTAYVLFTGGLMLLGGRATDLLGRRRVFLTGLFVFTAASLTSGLAWSPAALVAARAVQGIGAALLGVAAVLLAAFAAIERVGRDPLVPPATWRARPLVASSAVMLGATGVLVGTFFLNTVYLQRVLGDSALQTGLAFLPLTAVILLAAHVASHLLEHAGSRVVALVGLALMAGGSLLLAAAPDRASYLQDLLPGLLVLGLGVGLTFVAASVTAMAEVGHDQAGLASRLMTTAHELGAPP